MLAAAAAMGSTQTAIPMATASFTSATGTANDCQGHKSHGSLAYCKSPFSFTSLQEERHSRTKLQDSVGKPAGFHTPSFPCSIITVVTFIS
jgi:hypothetical protein